MTEWIWINGEVIPLSEATVSIEDRGFQFADGVYEVIRLYNGRPFTLDQHLARLERSARGIEIVPPMSATQLKSEIGKLLSRASLHDGMIYLQLTRGVAPRNHIFPQTKPTLLFYARELPPMPEIDRCEPVKLRTVVDERWKRCWVKSIALLPNVLAKNYAITNGADEAVFTEYDCVTECSASNLFAIIGKELITHPVGPKVLPGITRMLLLDIAAAVGLKPVERPLTESEAETADELFITSTTREIAWVSHWNGKPVSPGHYGEKSKKLHAILRDKIARETA